MNCYFSSFFMDHGNNNEAKSLSSNLFPYFHIPRTTDSNVDLNTLTTEGIYTIQSGYNNGPATNNCLLLVIMHVGTPFQLWMSDNEFNMYKRCSSQDGRFTGTWTKLF